MRGLIIVWGKWEVVVVREAIARTLQGMPAGHEMCQWTAVSTGIIGHFWQEQEKSHSNEPSSSGSVGRTE